MRQLVFNSVVGALLGAVGACGLMLAIPGNASVVVTIIVAYGSLVGGAIGMVVAITAANRRQEREATRSAQQKEENRA